MSLDEDTSRLFSAKKYLLDLGLNAESLTERYLFTSNLKEWSGAILHKTVFAFRLACLIAIEKYLHIKLPTPPHTGKEIDHQNISKMIEILKEDFSDNHIIIASIFDNYNMQDMNRITINQHLIDNVYVY